MKQTAFSICCQHHHVGGTRDACTNLIGKSDKQRPFGNTKCRWKDNVNIGLKGMRYKNVDWNHLVQDRDYN
jgi:hypothetical protein